MFCTRHNNRFAHAHFSHDDFHFHHPRKGTRHHGNPTCFSPLKPVQIVIGKVVPYVFISFMIAVIILVLGFTVFGMPVQGSLILLMGRMPVVHLNGTFIGNSYFYRNPNPANRHDDFNVCAYVAHHIVVGLYFPLSKHAFASANIK